MDFTTRNAQPQTAGPATHVATGAAPASKKSSDKGKWSRITAVVLLAAVAILLLGLVAVVATGNRSSNQKQYVDSSKLQAVFLNTGQVYFGNIKALNSSYFVLTNIYYLQTSGGSSTTSTSSSNTSVSLVKLGCELHEPYDQMVINSSQVTFWENLQSDGQVAKAVATFEKDNPNGQKCTDQSSSSSNTSNSVQNATNSSSSTSKQ